MKAFWWVWILIAVPLDYWCHKTHHTTLTRAIIMVPAIVTLPLMIWGILHIVGAYVRLRP